MRPGRSARRGRLLHGHIVTPKFRLGDEVALECHRCLMPRVLAYQIGFGSVRAMVSAPAGGERQRAWAAIVSAPAGTRVCVRTPCAFGYMPCQWWRVEA